MRRVLVVTGTGPGVGKTVVTAAIAALAVAAGGRVAVLKPAQTGVRTRERGDLDDVARLKRCGRGLDPAGAVRRSATERILAA